MALNFGKKIDAIRTNVTAAGCTDAAMMESIEQVAAASEALYEAQADGALICQVLDNLGLASQALAKGGLSKQVIGAFNSENELSDVCGQEALTVEGLEALGEADVKALEAKYVAGLEGQMAEYWNKLIAWLKNLWVKIVEWAKNIMTNYARYANQLEAISKTLTADKFNADATVSAHKKSVLDQAVKGADNVAKQLSAAAQTFKQSASTGEGAAAATSTSINRWQKNGMEEIEAFTGEGGTEGTLKSFGYGSVNDVKNQIDDYIKWVKSSGSAGFGKASKDFTDGLQALIKEAGNAGKLEGEAAAKAKEAVNAKRAMVVEYLAAIRKIAGCFQKAGGELLKIAKACQTKSAK
jgi:hypothetical protein